MRVRFMMWCAAAAIFLGSAAIHAHEIGTTQVSVVFQQRASYEIEIVTDAISLVEKLEALSGGTPQSLRSAAAMQVQLQTFDEVFRRRLVVGFDGSAVRPAIDYSVSGVTTATSSPVATIRLRGAVPQGARRFAWTYSWTFATYSLTVREAGTEAQTTEWLEGGQSSTPIPLALPNRPPNRATIGLRYLALGFTHIVPNGFDHMLFVLGIFLLGRRLRQVLAQVSAFTIAHSITLALSVYGIVSVSPRVVEPLIAVSIAYVAIENIFMSELKPWRLALVFAFGLLHGMGFAGALKELGLPRSEFVLALATFNLGVEAGQLAVIAAAFLLVGWYCGSRHWYRRLVVVPASALIACTAVYWTVERLGL
ncbi:MAG TPA: HupE/UreJ family protein [Terriglobia bacterium]|nr:HupE/UreJ family protein [Terriglobia bacterium]